MKTKLRNPDIWLQEHEDSGKFDDCACTLAAEYTKPGDNPSPAFFMCPLHRAAPEMFSMLCEYEIAWEGEEDSVRSEHRQLIKRLKATIKKAEA